MVLFQSDPEMIHIFSHILRNTRRQEVKSSNMAAESHYSALKPFLYSLEWGWVKCWASRAGNTHSKHINVLYRGFKSQGLLNVNRNIKAMFYWSSHFKWIQRNRETKQSREVREEEENGEEKMDSRGKKEKEKEEGWWGGCRWEKIERRWCKEKREKGWRGGGNSDMVGWGRGKERWREDEEGWREREQEDNETAHFRVYFS